MTKDEFTSHTTSQWYSCKSSNVIYLTECKRCGHQYVEETSQPLQCRINSPIRHLTSEDWRIPCGGALQQPSTLYGDMAVTVIDKLYSPDPTLRKMRESRWIRDLRTTFPQGMCLTVDSLWIFSPPKTFEYWQSANYTISGCTVLPATIKDIERDFCYLNACNYSVPDEGSSGAET